MIKRLLLFVTVLIIALFTLFPDKEGKAVLSEMTNNQTPVQPSPTTAVLKKIPTAKTIPNDYHIIQTFNNCGPASLSMTLSYFGIEKSQQELGEQLRPFQHPKGDNDDKSVTLDELAKKAQEFDLLTYHRPNGDIELLKQFIANDIPVITRTWLHVDEDIGHYRVIKGYDDDENVIIQDDSYEGANLSFTYDDFNTMWSKFDYEYLVLVKKDKKQIAEKIIGDNLNELHAWKTAAERNKKELEKNPSDIYSRFNLSVAYYHIKEYRKSVEEFEKVENQLPFRTLWYQIEPILAYYELGDYDRVFSITDSIINNYNRAFSELYILRGKIYQKQGNLQAAKNEYQNAVYYNMNLIKAKKLLDSIQ